MKKTILIVAICLATLSIHAQTKTLPPVDTALCRDAISIISNAVQVISKSTIPTNESDPTRQQLTALAQYFAAYKAQLIAEDKKKKEKPKN